MKFFEEIMMEEYLSEAPIAAKGWTDKSVEKFGKTIGIMPDEHGFFEVCVRRMKSRMGDKSEGFCSSLKDREYNSTYWRGKDKTKKEIKQAVKKHPYTK